MIQDQNITVHIIMLKHLDLAFKQCSFRDHSQKNHASPLPDGLQQTFHLKINKVNQV